MDDRSARAWEIVKILAPHRLQSGHEGLTPEFRKTLLKKAAEEVISEAFALVDAFDNEVEHPK